jgi:hypothetical protein
MDKDETGILVTPLDAPRYAFRSASAQPVYHGETSMHDHMDARSASGATISPPEAMDTATAKSLPPQRLADLAKLRHKYASVEEGEVYLDAYFRWASPVYAVIHRPVFMRDMAVNGPYFSQLLLVVIYITGIRFTSGMAEKERQVRGEQLVSIALSLISDEMTKPTSIPTIRKPLEICLTTNIAIDTFLWSTEALLGLAGRQCAVGNSTQGWLFTGMVSRSDCNHCG